jgi:hypothetical protein
MAPLSIALAYTWQGYGNLMPDVSGMSAWPTMLWGLRNGPSDPTLRHCDALRWL